MVFVTNAHVMNLCVCFVVFPLFVRVGFFFIMVDISFEKCVYLYAANGGGVI